jgi:uncharacterized DUF497 family protein
MFEWDPDKSAANLAKHGVSFEEARLIFEGPVLSRRDDRLDYGETRTVSLGAILGVAVVAVVHTDRAGVTRLISARMANRKERRRYLDHLEEAARGAVEE